MGTTDMIKIDVPLESLVTDCRKYKFFVRIKKNNITFNQTGTSTEGSIQYKKPVESTFLGELTQGLNFLIKLSFKNHTNMLFLAESIRVVKKNLKFRRLVDFQLFSTLSEQLETLSSDTLEIFTSMKSRFFKKYYHRTFPLDIIPPFFTTFSLRKNQIHLNHDRKRCEKNKKKKKISSKKIKDHHIPIGLDRRSYANQRPPPDPFINFNTEEIPTSPWKQLVKIYPLCLFGVGLLGKVFKKKPIWLKKKIEKIAPHVLKNRCQLALQLFAFRFSKKSPFEYCWVRFGYDPRSSVRSNIFQSFRVKDHKSKTNQSMIKKKTGTRVNHKKYDAKNFMQLTDTKSSFLKNFLKKDDCLHKTFIHYKFGWFTKKGIYIIRKCKNIVL
jgi:hypothetical protein